MTSRNIVGLNIAFYVSDVPRDGRPDILVSEAHPDGWGEDDPGLFVVITEPN